MAATDPVALVRPGDRIEGDPTPGSGGASIVEAGPGDFLHVPKVAIHRESNPGDTRSRIVVVRAGEGPPVVNVDGPG
jgi:hypothetical protein